MVKVSHLILIGVLASLTACGGDSKSDKSPKKETSTSETGSGDTKPDTGDGDTKPDAGDGDTKPDAGDGDTKPDTGDGDTKPDTGDGDTKPDTGDGDTKPDTDGGDTDTTTFTHPNCIKDQAEINKVMLPKEEFPGIEGDVIVSGGCLQKGSTYNDIKLLSKVGLSPIIDYPDYSLPISNLRTLYQSYWTSHPDGPKSLEDAELADIVADRKKIMQCVESDISADDKELLSNLSYTTSNMASTYDKAFTELKNTGHYERLGISQGVITTGEHCNHIDFLEVVASSVAFAVNRVKLELIVE